MKKAILILFVVCGSAAAQALTTADIVPAIVKAEFDKQGTPFVNKIPAKDIKIVAKYISISKDLTRTWYATEYNESTGMIMVFNVITDRTWDFGPISVAELKLLTAGNDKEFPIYACTLQELIDGQRP